MLLLDAGDFMMGTLFELLATTASPELAMMHALGYDATTIGNHELDWTPHGLAGILQAAVTNDVTFPILSSNMKFSAADPGDDELAALASAGVIQPKLVKMVGGLKVGFFGLLGANAAQVTPQAAPLTFDPIDVAAARMVKELRETDQVDLVIALSHSGIDHDGQGEDAVLAAKVPGIDIIISGHTHETLAQPVAGREHADRHRRRLHRLPRRAGVDRDALGDAGRAAGGRGGRQLHAAEHRRHDRRRPDHAGGRRQLHRGARHGAGADGPRPTRRSWRRRRPTCRCRRAGRRRSATW